jgi:branched-chain amino acid transport system permease protein
METALVDRDVAATLGVNLTRLSILLQVISAVISGIAGVIFAFTLRTIFPDTYSFSLLLYIWCMLYLGGRFTMWGAIISAPILWGLPQWIPHELGEYSNILYGALLIAILLLRPQGIISRGLVRAIRQRGRIQLERLFGLGKFKKEVI